MPIELMSLLGGGLAGFVFRYLAQKAQDQKNCLNELYWVINKQQKIKT